MMIHSHPTNHDQVDNLSGDRSKQQVLLCMPMLVCVPSQLCLCVWHQVKASGYDVRACVCARISLNPNVLRFMFVLALNQILLKTGCIQYSKEAVNCTPLVFKHLRVAD